MSNPRPTAVSEVHSFDELVRGVERTLIHGKLQIERATVFANWETGRLIYRHILLNQHRAGYADQVMARLARRVGLSERVLYQCAQFHRRFQILNRRSKLSWSHYRALSQLDDDQRRSTLAVTAEKRGWTAAELEDRVRQLNLADADAPGAAAPPTTAAPVKPLKPRRGIPGRYPVVARGSGPTGNRSEGFALDLGFKIYLPLTSEQPLVGEERVEAKGAVILLPQPAAQSFVEPVLLTREHLRAVTVVIVLAPPLHDAVYPPDAFGTAAPRGRVIEFVTDCVAQFQPRFLTGFYMRVVLAESVRPPGHLEAEEPEARLARVDHPGLGFVQPQPPAFEIDFEPCKHRRPSTGSAEQHKVIGITHQSRIQFRPAVHLVVQAYAPAGNRNCLH